MPQKSAGVIAAQRARTLLIDDYQSIQIPNQKQELEFTDTQAAFPEPLPAYRFPLHLSHGFRQNA